MGYTEYCASPTRVTARRADYVEVTAKIPPEIHRLLLQMSEKRAGHPVDIGTIAGWALAEYVVNHQGEIPAW